MKTFKKGDKVLVNYPTGTDTYEGVVVKRLKVEHQYNGPVYIVQVGSNPEDEVSLYWYEMRLIS